MAQPFYARKIDLNIGPRKGETVYSAQAYYYGTITTKQVATQIAQESALTPADVIGVIERLAYFCQTHMALGYKIKLDGLGIFYNELLTEKSVSTPKEVTAKLVNRHAEGRLRMAQQNRGRQHLHRLRKSRRDLISKNYTLFTLKFEQT